MVYVSSEHDSTVSVISRLTDAVTATIGVGRLPFGGRSDDQVRHRRGTVLAAVGEQSEDFHRPVLDCGGQVLYRH
jgi:YVTN family beta-propeller protein